MQRADDLVLLFFADFERDSFVAGDRHLKRLVRPLYSRVRGRPEVSGFSMWFRLLEKSLRGSGYDVRVNDRRLAERNPRHPVGLVGYPHLLDDWRLPNPAVLGPSLFDHPEAAPGLMDDSRFRRYLVTCGWMDDLFTPAYGLDRVGRWYAGIDVSDWPVAPAASRSVDVLIYDKIRWNRDEREAGLVTPIVEHLRTKGLTYEVIRYGRHNHATYRSALSRSRAMIFLCEHETQGLAYQEALASNLPVLAWDNGFWLDPQRTKYQQAPVRATSVPYFSPACGDRFQDAADFVARFDRFWSSLAGYRPREYVRENLSLTGSASLYMEHYRAAGATEPRGSSVPG